jgi:hypothetical protein
MLLVVLASWMGEQANRRLPLTLTLVRGDCSVSIIIWGWQWCYWLGRWLWMWASCEETEARFHVLRAATGDVLNPRDSTSNAIGDKVLPNLLFNFELAPKRKGFRFHSPRFSSPLHSLEMTSKLFNINMHCIIHFYYCTWRRLPLGLGIWLMSKAFSSLSLSLPFVAVAR